MSWLTLLDAKAKDGEDKEDYEKKEKDRDEDSEKTLDATSILLAFVQDVGARVEILSPRMTFPTVDSADIDTTQNALCARCWKAFGADPLLQTSGCGLRSLSGRLKTSKG